uniref:F-box domain-containing protein n=1 Tax=Ditylenchus dipsaci TaxID=166011 RepID=A0A915EUB0_9BILA
MVSIVPIVQMPNVPELLCVCGIRSCSIFLAKHVPANYHQKLPAETIFDIFLFINYSCCLRILPILPSPLSQALRRTRQFRHFLNRNLAGVSRLIEKMDKMKSKFISSAISYQTFGVIYDILGSQPFVCCFDIVATMPTVGDVLQDACEEKDLDDQTVKLYNINADLPITALSFYTVRAQTKNLRPCSQRLKNIIDA